MNVILNCAPIFNNDADREMGIGLYPDGVYVDMRENFLPWLMDPDMLPVGESRETIRQKYLWAVGRFIENCPKFHCFFY